MLIPLRTDRYPKRRPIVTEALIVANLSVYLAGLIGKHLGAFDLEQFVAWGEFNPRDFRWWQLFTALFLHDPSGVWHVAFNMLALWVFAPPVEGRLGRAGFLGFYLMAGALANLAHMIVSPAPVIGASGAIAGVSGIFLALFPRSNVICFFLFGGALVSISSLWLIGLYFVIDVLNQTTQLLGRHTGNVAYAAHIAGYVYGFTLGFVLLGARVIPREECDVFFLFKQARRRAALRAANRGSVAGAWQSASADTGKRLADRKKRSGEMTPEEQRVAEQRAEIHGLATRHELAAAAAKYRALLRAHPDIALSEQPQLEIANQLAAEKDHTHAAAAYELLLERYPNTHKATEVRLMLGMIYARQLRKPERARELIERAKSLITDTAQRRLADQILAELHA